MRRKPAVLNLCARAKAEPSYRDGETADEDVRLSSVFCGSNCAPIESCHSRNTHRWTGSRWGGWCASARSRNLAAEVDGRGDCARGKTQREAQRARVQGLRSGRRATALAYKGGAGAFAGVPMLLKDIMGDCAGMPTRSACAFIPATPMPVDSELVARYKRAGFIPFCED